MNDIIIKLSIASSLIPIIAYFKYKSSFAYAKLLLYYVLLSLLLDLTSTLLLKHYNKSINFYVIHLFVIFEFILFFYFFRIVAIKKNKSSVYFIPLLIFHLSFYCLSALFTLEGFNSVGTAYFNLVIIIYCLLEFKNIIKSPPLNQYIERTSFFWILIGIFLYSSGNFYIFTFSELMINKKRDYFLGIWAIHNVLNMIKNICIAISFSRKIEK
jgi:hypothetical protein